MADRAFDCRDDCRPSSIIGANANQVSALTTARAVRNETACRKARPMRDATVVQSTYSFADTVERLLIAITNSGAALFVKIDQAKAARSVGLALRPTMLLIFGNPKAGTLLMEAFPLSALDLPLKLLVWEDVGAVWIAYTPIIIIAERYGVAGKDGLLKAMDAILVSVVALTAVQPLEA